MVKFSLWRNVSHLKFHIVTICPTPTPPPVVFNRWDVRRIKLGDLCVIKGQVHSFQASLHSRVCVKSETGSAAVVVSSVYMIIKT